MTCPVCGTVAVPGARFCHNCGAALPAAATLPAAERRVVTVLFGDLSDFTSWSEDLDPERVGAVTDRVLAALAGAVKTFGGHVDKLTGDGIMAVFGAPVAHEDDAERAVRAALAMQRAVRRVLDDERGGGAPLGLRVGLNTGDGGGRRPGRDRVHGHRRHGEHRGPAGRRGRRRRGLRRRAAPPPPPGTSPPGGSCGRCGSRASASRSRRTSCSACTTRRAPGPGLGDEAPFVGREAELGRVAGRLAEVIDRGEPRVLVFTAEAGIGKTRFAAEVERFAAGYDVGAGAVRRAHRRPGAVGALRRVRRAPPARAAGRPGPRRRSACPRDAATAVTRAGRRGAAAPARPAAEPAHRRAARRSTSTCCWPCSATASRRPSPVGPDATADWQPERPRADAEAMLGRGRRPAHRAGHRGAAGGDRRRPARRHRRDRRRARRRRCRG